MAGPVIFAFVKDSLKVLRANGTNALLGYTVNLHQTSYHSQDLSLVERLELYVDGRQVDPGAIDFCVNDKRFKPWELKDMYKENWSIFDDAVVEVLDFDGLAAGDHEVTLLTKTRCFRAPFDARDREPHTNASMLVKHSETMTLHE